MSTIDRLLGPLEATANRLLALDPETPARLRPLAGRSVGIELPGTELILRADFSERGVSLGRSAPEDPPADADVRLSPAAALALVRSRGERSQGVEFRGDVAVVHALRRLVGGLEIDWEEQLAQLTGDVFAHQAGLAVGGVFDWLGHARRTAEANLGEYLTEERRLLPPAAEAAAFLDDVDRLRQDCDRLQARIERLERPRAPQDRGR
jgi:ubiquinone biosynthesis protein UbiJ